ncbi:MAG TPA: hypothetical protein VKT82_24405 [Ktedonobacterales bacterium]|nr:hypothetical protein [Ktedonobacterales bacterium]
MMARGTSRIETDAESAARRLVGHLHYLQYRPRRLFEHRSDRWIFGAMTDHAQPTQVRAAVLAPGERQVVLHTFLLAPEEEAVCDYRAWTRQFVAEHEQTCLCWFGVLHAADRHADTPHVHVGLVKAQASSPRLLRDQRTADQTEQRPSGGQGGVLLRLSSLAKKEAR